MISKSISGVRGAGGTEGAGTKISHARGARRVLLEPPAVEGMPLDWPGYFGQEGYQNVVEKLARLPPRFSLVPVKIKLESVHWEP